MRVLCMSALVAVFATAASAATGNRLSNSTGGTPSIKATADGFLITTDVKLQLGDSKIRSLREASENSESNARAVITLEDAIVRIANLNSAEADAAKKASDVASAVAAEKASCDKKEAGAVLAVKMETQSSVMIFSAIVPECEPTKVCSSARKQIVHLYGKGLAIGEAGLYRCVLKIDNGTESPDITLVGTPATVEALGDHRQKVTCEIPAASQPGGDVRFKASLFLMEGGVYTVPSAGGFNPLITFDNVAPVIHGLVAPCKNQGGAERPKRCGLLNEAQIVGKQSNLFSDGQTIQVTLDYEDYYDGNDVEAEFKTKSAEALPDISTTFTLNKDSRALLLKFDRGWMNTVQNDRKSEIPEVQFEVTLTDSHKASATKLLTLQLLNKLKPYCISSCKDLKTHYAGEYNAKNDLTHLPVDDHPSGVWSPCGGGKEFYCEMDIDGGGWTFVANIAPSDGNSVGYNNQPFWTGGGEYGSFSKRFSNDYKHPLAQSAVGDIMIVSTKQGAEQKHLYESGVMKGYRIWGFAKSFDSMFSTGIVGVHATDSCETGSSKKSVLGTVDLCDDIIRRGNCLYADVNPSSSGHADLMRLTTISYNTGQDNKMAGFASCINCGPPWQGGNPNMGMDRAACCSTSCHYNAVKGLRGYDGKRDDCRGNYCNSGHYPAGKYVDGWNSRFFTRDDRA